MEGGEPGDALDFISRRPADVLKTIADLDLPYFYPDGSSDFRPVTLYQVAP